MVELPAEAAAGQAWVKAMPTGTFLVQHAATPRFQDAMQWRQRFPALDKAKVVAVRSPNDKLWSFVVLSGPYVSLLEAVKYSKNPGLPLAAQIRSARSLKAQFKTPSEAGQESR